MFNDNVAGRPGMVEKFFDSLLNELVYSYRRLIIAISVIWFLVSVYGVAEIGPASKKEVFVNVDEDLPDAKAIYMMEDLFYHHTGIKDQVTFLWGTSGLDRSRSSLWNHADLGSLIFDPLFQMNTIES